MKRELVVATLCLLLFTPQGAVAADQPDKCQEPINNSTTQALCEQIDQLQQKNAKLETKVEELNGKLETLEYKLKNSGSSLKLSQLPDAMDPFFKGIGMWNPYTDQPALIIRYETGGMPFLWQYKAPGLGSQGPLNAWVVIAEPKGDDVRPKLGKKAQNITFSLQYARKGMSTRYEISPSEYDEKTKQIARKMNTLHGWIAHTQYSHNGWSSAKSLSNSALLVGVVVGIFLIVVGSLIGEYRTPLAYLRNRRQASENEKDDTIERQNRPPITPEEDEDSGFLGRFR